MPNKNRERQIIAAVGCPECGARKGKRCNVNPASRAGEGRPVLHSARRRAWQASPLHPRAVVDACKGGSA